MFLILILLTSLVPTGRCDCHGFESLLNSNAIKSVGNLDSIGDTEALQIRFHQYLILVSKMKFLTAYGEYSKRGCNGRADSNMIVVAKNIESIGYLDTMVLDKIEPDELGEVLALTAIRNGICIKKFNFDSCLEYVVTQERGESAFVHFREKHTWENIFAAQSNSICRGPDPGDLPY